MTNSSTPSRNLLRSTGAILAGFIAVFVLSLGTDQIFHALDIYPPWEQPMTDTSLLLPALTYRIVYGIAGGYIVARLAPRNPTRHALITGGIAMWDMGEHWYPIVLALSSVPCSWAGAVFYLKRRAPN